MNSYRNNRKNRFKSNGDRIFRKRSLNGHKIQNDFSSNNEFRHRSPGRNNQNASKLVDKYSNLAREALSSGDKILSENYLQHADHFTRILNERESFRKEKYSENRIENNSGVPLENIENSEQNSNKEMEVPSEEENKIQKSDKPQVEVI